MKSYLEKMRKFRSGNTQAAVPGSGTNHSSNPVNEKGLSTSKRPRTISTSSGLKRTTKRSRAMAKKRKRCGSARKRDAKGHFVKTKTRTKRRKATKSKRKVRRVKGALGRTTKGKFTRKRRHRRKAHTRKVGKRRICVRSHLSHEEKPKRRRRRARHAQEEATMPRRKRRRAKKAVTRRRRRRHVAENPVRRRRRRRAAMAHPRRKRRRAKGRKLSTKALCRRPSRRRPRYVYTRRGKASSKRRKSYARRSKKMMTAGPEPVDYYAFENPLSGGELLLAGFTGTLGYVLTGGLDRFLANSELATSGSSSIASGQSPMDTPVAVLTKPGLWRCLAQAGAAAVPFVGAYWVKEPMGRAALQGLGLGALIHLGGQVIEHYVIARVAGGQPVPSATAPATGLLATLNQLYAPEIVADNLSDQVTTGTAGTLTAMNGGGTGVLAPGTISGIPFRGIGRVLKSASKGHHVPRALGAARGTGDCGSGDAASAAANAASAWANSANGDHGGCGDEGGGDWTPPTSSGGPPAVSPQPPTSPVNSGSGNGAPTPFPILTPPGNGSPIQSPLPPMNGGGNGVYNPNGNPTPLAGVGRVPDFSRLNVHRLFPD